MDSPNSRNIKIISDWCLLTAISITTLSFLFYLLVTIYRKIRYSIPAKVNCWFCNVNTKVSYSSRNCWICPHCHQYNGFTPEGDYNKRIPAQFIESLNRPIRATSPKGYKKTSNGLCTQCNLNQELKLFQLSSFVPNNEAEYDKEIEIEQKRLEEIYDLCSICKLVVKQKLKRITTQQSTKKTPANKIHKVGRNVLPLSEPREEEERRYSDNNSDSDGDCMLKKLKIGSPCKYQSTSFTEKTFSMNFPNINMMSASSSPSNSPTSSPSVFNSTSFLSPYGNHYSPAPSLSPTPSVSGENFTPLWKDYPLVHNAGFPTSFSCVDGLYPYKFKSSVPHHNNNASAFYNNAYRSSSTATIFGGRKSLLSPPKLGYCYNSSFSSASSGVYPSTCYGVTSSDMFIPPFFQDPISRSSSQTNSGFISQPGGVCATPPPSVFSGRHHYSDNNILDRMSVMSEPMYMEKNSSQNSRFFSQQCPQYYNIETKRCEQNRLNIFKKMKANEKLRMDEDDMFSDDEDKDDRMSSQTTVTTNKSDSQCSRKSTVTVRERKTTTFESLDQNVNNRKSRLYQTFISLSVLLNIILLVWLFYWDENHLLYHIFENVTDVVTNYFEYGHTCVVKLISAKLTNNSYPMKNVELMLPTEEL